ncbi:hypothetical protein CC1G_14013 [Coprinopsis cinerea okayama7|uniref:Cytochrome P450 n=1 Tax=Coprinopsis cinerea (strain Okayama-7 / 130 / ATCC MYA-4618 / FGSC 9003) TaxID=240176 RepID=D6RKT7_COPC7|nr:hypothetical protein CC1G_14013 [Coprinopsis cinerea okayama7\|eukprot:XP_002911974.1 hypothetical protein CC1G_14013 [Coprinopsis cinerea okayama7\
MITDTLRDWALSWSAAATVFAGAILAHVFLRQSRRSRYPLPPGPRRIPFLGNAHQMPMAEPWRVYKEWSHKYGDMIYLEAMRQPIVVLNSFKVMQEILVKRAANYSDRIISHPDAM